VGQELECHHKNEDEDAYEIYIESATSVVATKIEGEPHPAKTEHHAHLDYRRVTPLNTLKRLLGKLLLFWLSASGLRGGTGRFGKLDVLRLK
jgi:hypothetical protein